MQLMFSGSLLGTSVNTSVDVLHSATASDHVKNCTDSHAATNDGANPNIELCESKRCAENVKERFDPEGVDKSTVFH